MLFLLVRLQAIGDTGFDVVPDDELADASEGFMNRRNLGERRQKSLRCRR